MIESIMPIVMLIIIVAVSSAVSKQKAAMQRSRQGQRPAPMLQPQQVDEPDDLNDMDEPDEAGEQISFFDGVLDESDYARTDLTEGESRECDHGSIGGSMDITTHMGQGEDYEPARTQVTAHTRPAANDDQPAPLMSAAKLTAQDMRRAVIMAEILKRPSERYARR